MDEKYRNVSDVVNAIAILSGTIEPLLIAKKEGVDMTNGRTIAIVIDKLLELVTKL